MALAKIKTATNFTPEDYLNFEREADARHEFLDGEIYQMAGESLSHSRVCVNLSGEVRNKLKGKPCELLSPNMKVRTSTASLFSYPRFEDCVRRAAISRQKERCFDESASDF